MRFGCCVRTVEQIHVLAQAGYDFCELPAAAVHPFEDEAAALPALREIEAAPLRPESFNVLVPAQLPLAGPRADLHALRTYLRRAFPRMARAGAALVVLGSGAARRIPDEVSRDQGLEQLADAMSMAAEEASWAGLELALEPLNRSECNVFNTLAESQAFIQDRGLGNVRLVADLHHIEMESEPLRNVVEARPLLAHVQVADGRRKAPGGGGYDFPGFMRALRETGYDRRISAECQWDDLAGQAAGALAFMRQQWEGSVPALA
jgi:D-psicose/D-tagatose/L-ribulose 3-epimerase